MPSSKNNNDYKLIMSNAEILDYFAQHGVKPSMQRMAVMKYLLTHRTHPTVDEIYNDVVQEIPTLSKATVYNTLRLLVKQGAALQITINEQCTCYDGDITPHAHFFCRNCGRVYDMPLNWQDISEMADVPAGFKVDEAALYFRGLCSNCSETN